MKPKASKNLFSAKDWLDHAGSDLKMAKIGMEFDVFPSQICFHAQQAAEKALKAVLLHLKIDFPFVHDLEQLLTILENEKIIIPDEISNIGILTPYAVETRYPGDWGEITAADIAAAIDLAEKTVHWAENYITAK